MTDCLRGFPYFRLLLLLAFLSGCSEFPSTHGDDKSGRSIRWVIVEKPHGRLSRNERRPSQTLNPGTSVLIVEPIWTRKSDSVPLIRISLLSIMPQGNPARGETVTVTLRLLGANPEASYRLIALPNSPDTEVLSPDRLICRGDQEAEFRFTRLRAGRGGIIVTAKEVLDPAGYTTEEHPHSHGMAGDQEP